MDNVQNKKRSRRLILIICIAALLAAAIIIGAVAVVIMLGKSPVVMECEGQRIRLDFYEFMLSRMKGELYNSRYDVRSDSFWNDTVYGTGKTYEQYYNDSVFESCKVYLATLFLYEKLISDGEISGLPSEYTAQIEEDIQLYIDLSYVGGGSEKKFQEILSEYGVDVKTLREIYTVEAKMQFVREYLYGGSEATKIGDAVKQEYYEQNYYRIKNIPIRSFYYQYICDKFGNKIYFDGNTKKALYDYEKGEKRYDENGMYIKDADGAEIAFDRETGEYLYDTKDGSTRFVSDDNGDIKKFYYTEKEMEQRLELARSLCNTAKGDPGAFEKAGMDVLAGTADYDSFVSTDGIYMSDVERSSYSDYMTEMLERVKTMVTGDVAMVEADGGCHVFMKYELDAGAYSKEGYEKWFRSFNSSLITKMFFEKCQSVFDKIEINTDNLKKAKSIKDVGINTDY